MNNNKSKKGRAKRKTITQLMALKFVDIAKEKGTPEKAQPYWNAYYCQNRLIEHDGRLYGRYCRNRHCTLCAGIRKAELINKYYPTLKQWEQPHFVTLTVKAQPLYRLKTILKKVQQGFRFITKKYRKRHQRGNDIKLMGIKSLECNYNPKARTYNPHLHLIVPNKETAEIIIKEWLEIWTNKFAVRGAQHHRPVGNKENDLTETIKYKTKIFTNPDGEKATRGKGNGIIYAKAIYNILEAMKGLRTFERFGFNTIKQETGSRKGTREIKDYREWYFSMSATDWIDSENNEPMTGYAPSHDLANTLCNRINTQAE